MNAEVYMMCQVNNCLHDFQDVLTFCEVIFREISLQDLETYIGAFLFQISIHFDPTDTNRGTRYQRFLNKYPCRRVHKMPKHRQQ